MEKEIKKLKSRQDVLLCWVEKGATIGNIDVKAILYEDNIELFIINEGVWKPKNLYEILYSPESNFFEVMFGRKRKVQDSSLYTIQFEGRMSDFHKAVCVLSDDPLRYLISNLNETTS